jgi:hypothetical protein
MEHLDGHVAIEAWVARSVHLAHTSGPDQRVDFIGTETCACGEGHEPLIIGPWSLGPWSLSLVLGPWC